MWPMTSLPAVSTAATPPATRGGPDPTTRRRPRLGGLRRWVSPVLILAVWQAASSVGVLDPRDLAAPSQIAASAVEYVGNGVLGEAILASLQRVVLGFLIGAAIALSLALLAGLSTLGDDAVDPPMQMLRTLPHFGLIPLFITWMGIGEAPKVALIAMGVCFPLYLNTVAGIRGIDRKVLEAARSMHLTWAQRVRHVVLPGALPQTLTGLRQSLGIAWLSLIVAETISPERGLGYMINQAREFYQTDVIVLGLAVYSLLGLGTDLIVRRIERRALSWRA